MSCFINIGFVVIWWLKSRAFQIFSIFAIAILWVGNKSMCGWFDIWPILFTILLNVSPQLFRPWCVIKTNRLAMRSSYSTSEYWVLLFIIVIFMDVDGDSYAVNLAVNSWIGCLSNSLAIFRSLTFVPVSNGQERLMVSPLYYIAHLQRIEEIGHE